MTSKLLVVTALSLSRNWSSWTIALQRLSPISPTMSIVQKSVSRIVGSNAHLMICDIQERFRPLIHQMDPVINKAILLNKACNTLEIPTLITEQYPKVFGNTVPEISVYPGTQVFAKKQFSMISPEISTILKNSGRTQVMLLTLTIISLNNRNKIIAFTDDRLSFAVSRHMYVFCSQCWTWWREDSKCTLWRTPCPARGTDTTSGITRFFIQIYN